MKTLTFLFTIVILAVPEVSSAQAAYSNLISIPGVDTNSSFGGYINALYLLSISVAAILAVIKIIIGGVKYMLTDIVTSKSDAKKEIVGALLGLLLIISAVLILTVINSNIVDNDVGFQQVTLNDPNSQSNQTPQNNSGLIASGGSNNNATPSKLAAINTTCQAKIDSLPTTTSASHKQNVYNTCVSTATSKLKSDCDNIYGQFDSNTLTCKAPTSVRYVTDFSSEFAAYKKTLTINDPNYYMVDLSTPPNSLVDSFCTQSGGTFIKFYTWRNVCVKY